MAIGLGQTFYPLNYISIVTFVPRNAGIYMLFNESGWMHIGESEDLADGLIQQLMEVDISIMRDGAPTFQFEVVLSVEDRKARLNQLTENLRYPE